MPPPNQSSSSDAELAAAISELKSELVALEAAEKTKPLRPLNLATLNQVLSIRPASSAIDELLKVIPHVPGPDARYNDLQRDLNLIYAMMGSLGARHGLALIIDYLGPEYDTIIEILDHYGARTTAAYLREGRVACGGKIPEDEIERVEIALRHEAELDTIDHLYEGRLADEASECFVSWMLNNAERTLEQLNQITPRSAA